MKYVATYEVRSNGSVIHDHLVLRIKHPQNLFRARIQNISRSTYENPFLLSLHLYFDAPSLREAKDVADKRLGKLTGAKGDQQDLFNRIYKRTLEKDGRIYSKVLSTDMDLITLVLKRGDKGDWQDLFREILKAPTALLY